MRILSGLLALVACFLAFGPARADSLSVGFDPGVLNTTPAIVSFKTKGSDMTGMAITFTFADASTATSYWSGGSNSLGDSGGVTLSMTGDTYFTQWSLTNASGMAVTSMVIDAGLGDTAFDQTFKSLEGTAKSSSGRTFSPTTGKTGLDMKATYSDLVAVDPGAAVGDLYRMLTVDFTNKGGFDTGRIMKFWADTDTVEPLTIPTDIKTPAPPALLLALLGVPLLLRRRRKTEEE